MPRLSFHTKHIAMSKEISSKEISLYLHGTTGHGCRERIKKEINKLDGIKRKYRAKRNVIKTRRK